MPYHRKSRKTRRRATTRKTSRNHRSTRFQKRGGNRLGSIPGSAIVTIQPDAYSAPIMTDVDTAENIFEAREPYLL